MCEEAYKLANGVYRACAVAPRATPDQDAVAWTGNDDFDAIDFTVSGDVRFVYEVVVGDPPVTFTAGALGDTDGDGTMVLFTATNTASPAKVTEETTVGSLTGGPDD